MKRITLFLLSFISVQSYLGAQDFRREQEALREKTRLMQEGFGKKDIAKQAAKGAVMGALAPSVVGSLGGAYYEATAYKAREGEPKNVPLIALWGLGYPFLEKKYRWLPIAAAATGAALNVARNYALMAWQVRKITNALSQYARIEFKTLARDQAMLLVVAYKRNIPMMQYIVELQSEFVNQKGVWKALAELFFNQKPTKARVKELQKLIQES